MMEIRPIDGNALLTVPNVNWVYQYDETGEYIKYKAIPVEAIEKAPTLDLAPIKQADWLEHGCSTFCTRCGEKPLYDYFGKLKLSNYCPNCGAKMDGGKTDGRKTD